MISIGKYNELDVSKKTEIGVFLTDGRQEVLLPTRFVPQNIDTGDTLEVFVYLDNENRPVATTLKPFATVDEFAFLKVKEVNQHGAFLDWGISKDIFVPYGEQRDQMEAGKSYVVYILIDDHSGRIAATSRWMKYLDKDTSDLQNGDEVELLVAEITELGYRVIIDHQFEGLIYKNEVFEQLNPGDRKRGYIKLIRDDGKIDISLQQQGYAHIEDSKLFVLHQLKNNNGILNLGDKSSPEDIYSQLKLSKKAFKKITGALYKERLITVSDFEIRLV